MKYTESVQKALHYIEENLYEEINPDKTAAAAGYSKYHFLRIFKEELHMTPTEYIRKRRLTESARDISDKDESIAQIGYKHGFNSKENFTRAFKAEHYILPSDYRNVDSSLKLLHKNTAQEGRLELAPDIIEVKPFTATVYKSDEEDCTKFWNRYNCEGLSGKLSGGEAQPDYGFSVWNFSTNKLDYYIGILTGQAKGDLTDTMQLKVEGGLYAVFETPKADKFTFVSTIRRTWDYIYGEWIPPRGYSIAGDLDFETYKEDSREFSERIYIHLKNQ